MDGSVSENAGFLRKDAFLAIVILSDEDDCSASKPAMMFEPRSSDELGAVSDWRCAEFGWQCDGKPIARAPASYGTCEPRKGSPYMFHPQEFVDFIRKVKTNPNRIFVATVVGPPSPVRVVTHDGYPDLEPSCTRPGQAQPMSGMRAEGGFPMPRIKYFADAFAPNNTFVSICDADLSAGLTKIAEALRRLIETTCLTAPPLDADRNAANGLQADCVVSERTPSPTTRTGFEEAVLPRCPGTPDRPCWSVVEDRTKCPASGYKVEIDRRGNEAPKDTTLAVKCATRAS